MRILNIMKNKKYVRPIAAVLAVLIVCAVVGFSAGKTAGTKTSAQIAALAATQVLTTSVPLNAPINEPVESKPTPSIADAAGIEAAPVPDSGVPSTMQAEDAPAVQTGYAVSFLPINDIYYPDLPAFPQMPSFSVAPDTFVFITYGHGHGVGMSQYGAVALARHGYDFLSILAHYYQGVGFVREVVPCEVSTLHTGQTANTFELMCRVVQNEIAGVTKPGDGEALKAQAVVAYTQLKYYNYKLPNKYTMSYVSDMSKVSSEVIAAVSEVYGTFMTYGGSVIAAPFGAFSAGVTASGYSVWGADYPYLRPVTSYYDWDVRSYSGYADLIDVKSFTSEQIRRYIKNYDSSIRLGEDPATWLQVLAHDKALSPEIGYITAIRVGDRVLTERDRVGEVFRMYIMDLAIKSQCFSLIYFDNSLVPHDCGAVMA
ncbi:MAG: hypothetical protein IK118_08805 [Clostridia bacterium]|nr:hypothetical protein [Clostridia bacterium]